MQDLNNEITPKEITPSRVPRKKQESSDGELVQDRKDLAYQQRRGAQLVRGRFVNDETPGETKNFAFRKFKEPIKTYHLKDNGIYELPLSVAEHLNTGCRTPIYGAVQDENGVWSEKVIGWRNRCHFESLDFIDVGATKFLDPYKETPVPLLVR